MSPGKIELSFPEVPDSLSSAGLAVRSGLLVALNARTCGTPGLRPYRAQTPTQLLTK